MMTRQILIITIAMVLIISFIIFTGCNKEASPVAGESMKEDIGMEGTAGEELEKETQEEAAEEGSTQEETAAEASTQDENEGETEDAGEEIPDEEAAEEITIPEEVAEKIEEAQKLFTDGLYAEASKEFRNAQIAIDGSDLPDEKKDELLAQIEEDYNESVFIMDTARMHHSNAMTLIYEKRYEEAEAELNAALEIYPKYQTAIDALGSLEDIKGLQ
jgi:tetratricopeptide (TPR) repeat protein